MIEVSELGVVASEADRTLVADAMRAAFLADGRAGDASILLTTEEEIRVLNRDFRNVDAVTDVLTFPAWEGETLLAPPDGYLGDVAICVPRAAEQAEAYGHALSRELAFLAVHGALHLLGYDHMEEADERVMREKQTEILNGMGLKR